MGLKLSKLLYEAGFIIISLFNQINYILRAPSRLKNVKMSPGLKMNSQLSHTLHRWLIDYHPMQQNIASPF